ncbi:sucrase ferredoxin [Halomonas sp. NCCP-2165]|nr:sucrase ferredoxin [Halomonas sp. NCCP-2165]GKW49023.1 hypothetical protein NCCP2165_12380 [Halomonas sp. NCCP-2165]
MSAVQQFCAVESAAQGDPLVGSGAHAERNLLLSWPRPKWGRNLRRANDMSEALLARLDALAEGGRRVNLIHRRDQPRDHHRLYLMPENRAFTVPRDELPAFLEAFERDADLTAWEGPAPAGPLLLCCTHGKKDKCCAKFGYATYKALAEAVEARPDLPFEVWESTHLGGCRLAASALVFPALRKYGRIPPDDVIPLLESETAGRPYLPCYRGDSRLGPLEQCAQVAALEWLAERGEPATALEVVGVEARSERARVTLAWRGRDSGEVSVTCESRELLRFDTCADIDGDGPSPSTVWQATAIEPR